MANEKDPNVLDPADLDAIMGVPSHRPGALAVPLSRLISRDPPRQEVGSFVDFNDQTIWPNELHSVFWYAQEDVRYPLLWVDAKSGCDGLLISRIRVGQEDQLAVDNIPAALFEDPLLPGMTLLVLPSIRPGVRFLVDFENRGSESAVFTAWFGEREALRKHYRKVKGLE